MAQILHSYFFQNALYWYVWDAKFICYLFSNNTLICCHNSTNFGHTSSSFLNVSGLPLPSSSSNSWPFLAQWYQMYMTDISVNHTEAYDSYHCWLKNLKFTRCAELLWHALETYFCFVVDCTTLTFSTCLTYSIKSTQSIPANSTPLFLTAGMVIWSSHIKKIVIVPEVIFKAMPNKLDPIINKKAKFLVRGFQCREVLGAEVGI